MAGDGGSCGLACGGASGCGDAGCGRALHFMEEFDEASETLLAGGLVAGDRVGGVFPGAHEAVTGAVVGHRLVFLAGGLHGGDGAGNGGSDAGVVAGVETVHGSGDGGDVCGAGTVKDEGRGEIVAVSGEGEGFAAPPAEADDREGAVGGGQMLAVVGRGVEIGVDGVGIEAGDGFDGGSWLGNSLVPPPLGPRPLSRSGATTMKPSAASSSDISLAQSLRPKIS